MELESGQSYGNPRHHVAPAFDPSPNIAVAAQLAPTTQKPRLIRRSASSRQKIILRLGQAMWSVCNAYPRERRTQRQLGSDKGFTTIIVASMEVAAWSPTSGQRQVSTATSNHAAAARPLHLSRLTKTVAGIPPRSTASVEVPCRHRRGAPYHAACVSTQTWAANFSGSVAGLKTETSLRSCA
jgi:hypothetical protein